MHRGWYSTTLSSYSSVSKKSDMGHPGLESRCWQGYTDHSHFTISTSSWRSHFPHFWGPTYHIGLTWIIWDSSNLKVIWLSSVQFSHSVMSDSLRPHGLQHTRPPGPSSTPRIYSNSCPLSLWCHPTISSSVVSFSSCLQSFQASVSFQMSQLFESGGQSIGVSASASVLPMNIQDCFPLGWTGWISLLSKGLSRVFSNTTVQKLQFFGAQLSL